MRWLVELLQILAAIVLAPLMLYRAATTGKYRRDWAQRTGRMPVLPPATPQQPRVWLHAVSMGEVNSIRGLVAAWRTRAPHTQFVISATTDTGIDRARQVFPDLTVIRYPLDLMRFVTRALDRIAPSLIVLVELEVWYQFIAAAASRGIPVAIVNGRVTEQSVQRFGWIRPVAWRMFSRLSWVGAQDEEYARRFRVLGVPPERVSVTGSLKWDAAELADTIRGSEALAAATGIDRARPLWVCGSTGPGEESVILEAFGILRGVPGEGCAPGLQLAIVPRKPERFDEVARLIRLAGYACIRRSESPDGTDRARRAIEGPLPVFLIDTMGELRKLYSLADVAFVGRSLARMGGSDTMEVAALGKPMVVGPHNHNFADVVQGLQSAGGLEVMSTDLTVPDVADDLAKAVGRLLTDREAARSMGRRGRETVRRSRGATQRTLDSLVALLPTPSRTEVTAAVAGKGSQ